MPRRWRRFLDRVRAQPAGRGTPARSTSVPRGPALSVAQACGEGYALGIRAAIAGVKGSLREAQQLAKASIAVMRGIGQGHRTVLGLG